MHRKKPSDYTLLNICQRQAKSVEEIVYSVEMCKCTNLCGWETFWWVGTCTFGWLLCFLVSEWWGTFTLVHGVIITTEHAEKESESPTTGLMWKLSNFIPRRQTSGETRGMRHAVLYNHYFLCSSVKSHSLSLSVTDSLVKCGTKTLIQAV